jgi:deoxycytidylate deaminase
MKFLAHAEELAKTSDYKWQIGATITQNGKVISSGVATDKTHPEQHRHNLITGRLRNEWGQRLHAEFIAMLRLPRNHIINGKTDLHVVRVLANGKRSMARPCATCMSKIKELGISNIYYSTPDGYVYERIIVNEE